MSESPSLPWRQRLSRSGAWDWRRALIRRLQLLAVVLTLVNVGAAFAGWHWTAEVLTHFAPHYAALAALLTLALAALRRWPWALLGLALLASNMWLVLSARPAQPASSPAQDYGVFRDTPGTAESVRLLLWNVNVANPDPERALAWILEHESALDVLVLLEIGPRWQKVVDVLARFYPHAHVQMRKDPFGLAVFSSLEGSDLRPLTHARSGLASTLLTAHTANGTPFAVWAMHAPPPLGAYNANERNRQLLSVARTARVSPLPMVVAGDLNVTPWSPWFRRTLAAGGLSDLGVGLPRGTWAPSWWPVDLGLPLDHVLASRQVRVIGRYLGPRLGSDHRPVVVQFEVTGG